MTSVDLDPALAEAPDRSGRCQPDSIGLCLSGGGYRAMLFHLRRRCGA